MRSTLSVALGAAVLLTAGPAPRAQSLRAVVARAEALGIRTGVAVADADDGRTVAGFRSRTAFIPASNQKLLTVAAFLDALGPDYRFRTGLRLRNGVLEVTAGGDPNWITGTEFEPASHWQLVAAQLREAGTDAVRDVRLLPGRFGGPARPEGWPADQLWATYCAPTGGHVVESGQWVLEIADGGEHDALARLVAPPGGLLLTGRIELTTDKRRGGSYGARVAGNRLALSGHFLRGARTRTERGAVDDPAAVYRESALHLLGRAGIRIDPDAPELDLKLPDLETPLSACLVRTLGESSNFDAEQLLRVLGAELRDDGSFAGGSEAVAGQLRRLCGPLPQNQVIVDGSGLSRGDRTTPEFVVRVLVAAAAAPWAEAFVGALPQPGEAGTLRKRFRESPVAPAVRAKTGTLRGASALSGYVRTRAGRLRAFSILMNWDRTTDGADPRALQEQLVEAMVE